MQYHNPHSHTPPQRPTLHPTAYNTLSTPPHLHSLSYNYI
nr:MAG TPA: hypothetical protein [Caudoviricetes sp.]